MSYCARHDYEYMGGEKQCRICVAKSMSPDMGGALGQAYPLAGAVRAGGAGLPNLNAQAPTQAPTQAPPREFLLADELRMEAFKAQARKRKEEADDQRRAKADPERGEAENTLALVREVMAKAARDGQHSHDAKIVKHVVREWCAEQLRAEGLVAIDRKDSLTLRVEWAL